MSELEDAGYTTVFKCMISDGLQWFNQTDIGNVFNESLTNLILVVFKGMVLASLGPSPWKYNEFPDPMTPQPNPR